MPLTCIPRSTSLAIVQLFRGTFINGQIIPIKAQEIDIRFLNKIKRVAIPTDQSEPIINNINFPDDPGGPKTK